MKLKYFTLLLAVLFQFQVRSQTYVIMVKAINSAYWGYADLKGNWILEAKYRQCMEFSEDGIAPIYDAGKQLYYFINLKGEMLKVSLKNYTLTQLYGYGVRGFHNGMIPVCCKYKWGFLDTNGELVIPAKYDMVTSFSEGYASARVKKSFFIIDRQGWEIPVKINWISDLRQFSEGLAPFESKGVFGFVDVHGRIAIPAQFKSVGYFSDSLAFARDKNNLLGYIDMRGNWIIKPEFTIAKQFDPKSGLALVKLNDQFMYVNRSGEFMIVDDSESLTDYSDGLAIGRKNGKVGFLNNGGQWEIPPRFDGCRDFVNGFAAAKQGDLWGVIDKKGAWVLEPVFLGIKDVVLIK